MKDKQKKRSAAKRVAAKETNEKKQQPKPSLPVGLMPYILGLVALFFAACLLFTDFTGAVGGFVNQWLKGWFSLGAYLIPPVMMVRAVCFKKEYRKGSLLYKWILSLLCVILLGVFYTVFFPVPRDYDYVAFYENGIKLSGGGSVCGLFSLWLCAAIGRIAAGIVSVVLILIFGSFIFGKSPVEVLDGISAFFAATFTDLRENAKDKRLARAEERERMRRMEEEELPREKAPRGKRPVVWEEDASARKRPPMVDEDTGEVSEEEADEGELPGFTEDGVSSKGLGPKPENGCGGREPDANEVLQEVFGTPVPADLPPWEEEEEGLEAQTLLEPERISLNTPPHEEDKEDEGYPFPPISLLKYEPVKKAGSFDEQERTAEKLVEALASFGVRTRVLDIAVGPTVTRYELQPDTGVRVRSIVNLADDIALKLAASGVRIEAPIPGKEAVGIEVPNRTVATVYLRELIESSAFADAESKLTVCLGMDVAGKPIYCNVTKMPHLLIAGATNMGKSVCMNSVITSILYKATPDEVKMILIDPKKVEMSIYNGIPHLIVPVVSEPKKAAGALAWAVSEMERRFALIEEVGVRNIANYNKTVASDPERKKEPYIVIIIDELADLMMTARDDVESSICRLAQKARAAGIHLIIGTQRPSVDVITGLIKANFPSRIAFTVSSQVDSRTIIDIAGAEKLMGRGDMLYAPVGSTKPIRVQGSFVSEAEVEAITDHLREHKLAQYSQEIQEQIEKEAARCGEKKHGMGFDSDPDNMGGEAGENDPVLPQAIKIAIETGKISTSFIQRKLQLGYSRAGRITDAMGNMGVIGPFNGSKPREVLWTMNQYMEWMAARDNKPGNFEG